MLEASSCRSEHFPPRRPTPVAVPTTPPQKPEGPPWPVVTSSQVSIKVAEASLEDIPTSISPIAAVSRTRSVTPLTDVMELWANANKALDDLLTTKASINGQRQRAVWELGIVLCQNESQAAASTKEAKAVCSQRNLDAWTTCSQCILEAKTACSMAVKKAKTTRDSMVQEAKATCSKAISKVEAQRVSQAVSFQKEHGNIMQDLEEQATGEESRSRADFLSTCQVVLYNSPSELKSILATSYHILLGQTLPLPPLALPQRTSLWKNSPLQLLPHPSAEAVSEAQKMAPFTRSCGEYAYRWNHSEGYSRRTSQLQEARGPSLVQNTQAKLCQGV